MRGLAPNDVPPATWFEQVVSTALHRYVIGQHAGRAAPSSEFATPEATGPE